MELETILLMAQKRTWTSCSLSVQFSSVAQLCPTLCDPMDCRLPCPSPIPGAYPNSHPTSRWCHPTISSSVIPFSSCLQSLPASQFFPRSQFFPSGDPSIVASASASALPENIQDWFPLGSTGLISLISRVFSNTTVQKHQLLDAQFSLWSNSHPCMTTGKTITLTRWTLFGKVTSLLFCMLSRLVITVLPRNKRLLISWLQVTTCSDFGAQENKVCYSFQCFPIYLPWSDGTWCHVLCFTMLSFKPVFSFFFYFHQESL